jgi:hypothetical protein
MYLGFIISTRGPYSSKFIFKIPQEVWSQEFSEARNSIPAQTPGNNHPASF